MEDVFLPRVLELAREDAEMTVWWGTEVEAASAIWRAVRAGRLTRNAAASAEELLSATANEWREVSPSVAIKRDARRMLTTHPLRAGDSLQLAAAVVAAGGDPATLEFVCFDERLAAAARVEGFVVLPERA